MIYYMKSVSLIPYLRLIMMSIRRCRSRWTMKMSRARIRKDVTVLAIRRKPRFVLSTSSREDISCIIMY